jgi:RimJ/RimL family protein N-acetyltransferase
MHIKTDRLVLKEIEEHDIDAIHQMNSYKEVEHLRHHS